ncbi:uncharacterized protein N7496_009779 [Penicillium cataractarum]|uniref:LicD/FKTN/FKRP nucleotidyltransferase domain-containing protein n=1 Tax=Penicillium cataractarum TaxID=2100454 RepID=A0A9W9RPL6_9EURO|nr:uncharacterized protein N7496_009779 [Penicillium cataractarum]KAJ5364066.1 hypothetical protein N7496_009779 [Penicillium cataractarum]
MRFSSSLLGLYGLLSASALAVAQPGDTDFMSVRENLAKDYESEGQIPTEKYFTESSFHYHYDGRFADQPLPDDKVTPHLSALIQTYLSTMSSIGAETWIMHGTLLSWWWNQKIFPWDNDLDVQISEPTIHFLAEFYNMTEHHFDLPGVDGGRKYLLEINPNYVVRSEKDRLNVIDARWIDTSSGLFIDITAVRKDEARRQRGETEALMCKDRHHYQESQIFPLRDSYFEDVPVKIPYSYTWLLEEEYGPRALTNKNFQGHNFNEDSKIWEHTKRSVKRFLRRGWRMSDLPTRSANNQPLVRMDAS